jgi:hypothetical protein
MSSLTISTTPAHLMSQSLSLANESPHLAVFTDATFVHYLPDDGVKISTEDRLHVFSRFTSKACKAILREELQSDALWSSYSRHSSYSPQYYIQHSISRHVHTERFTLTNILPTPPPFLVQGIRAGPKQVVRQLNQSIVTMRQFISGNCD